MVATAGKFITLRGCRGFTPYLDEDASFLFILVIPNNNLQSWLLIVLALSSECVFLTSVINSGYSVSSSVAMQVILSQEVMIPTYVYGKQKHLSKWELYVPTLLDSFGLYPIYWELVYMFPFFF